MPASPSSSPNVCLILEVYGAKQKVKIQESELDILLHLSCHNFTSYSDLPSLEFIKILDLSHNRFTKYLDLSHWLATLWDSPYITLHSCSLRNEWLNPLADESVYCQLISSIMLSSLALAKSLWLRWPLDDLALPSTGRNNRINLF